MQYSQWRLLMNDYPQDEINSLWQRLVEKGSNIDPSRDDSESSLINVAATITIDEEEKQEILVTPNREISRYADYGASDNKYQSNSIIFTRLRQSKVAPWEEWMSRAF